MTIPSVIFLVLSLLLVWGGLVASLIFLWLRSEVTEYPPGGEGGSAQEHLEHTGL